MFRYLVLGLLRDGRPRHGWALRNEYRARAAVEINSGSFYRELQRLVSDRLLRVADVVEADARRTPYVILDAGRSAFDRWLASRLATVEPSADDEVACRAVFLAGGDRERMRAALSEWQEQLWIAGKTLERERLDAVEGDRADDAPRGVLSLLLARRIKHVAADLEFVAEAASLFEQWSQGAGDPPSGAEGGIAESVVAGEQPLAFAAVAAAGAGGGRGASDARAANGGASSSGPRPQAAKRAPAPAVDASTAAGEGPRPAGAALTGSGLRVASGAAPAPRRRFPAAPGDPVPAIRMETTSKDYGSPRRGVRALDRVDLVVPRGQVLSLLGPSGSGKSTLLRIAAGLETPTSGAVSLLGRDLAVLPEERRCEFRLRSVGQVFQGARLLPGLDLRENVALPIAFLRTRRDDALARADEILDRVGIARAVRDRSPSSLAACDRQRVAIARALVAEPEVLFADEPSGSLESRAAREVLDLLSSLAAEMRLTLVVATHATETATFGDRTVVLRDGRIVRDVWLRPRRPAALRLVRPTAG